MKDAAEHLKPPASSLKPQASSLSIEVYDTTLRDGTQGEHVSLSLDEKLEIAKRLDWLGVHYIEGGWPFSNPKDVAFFREAARLPLEHARLAAFGSTRRARNRPEEDENLRALLASGAPVLTIFGKSWDLHVTDALRTDLATNLEMIRDSVAFLKGSAGRLIYDAEHFFDGFFNNREYALRTVEAAVDGGAETVVLCDTNGGRLPHEIEEGVSEVQRRFAGVPLGIHCHNDAGVAVANTLAAVRAGCRHVQGTVNGLGERCGNTDLCVLIPDLELKLGYSALGPERLRRLTEVSRFVYDTANLMFHDGQPYVGRSAFTHKGGVHVSAVQRNVRTYEHLAPDAVGNERRVLVSELSGRSNILEKTRHLKLEEQPAKMKEVLARLQELEHRGYQFEAAEASFELLVRRVLGEYQPAFSLVDYYVFHHHRVGGSDDVEAAVRLKVAGVEEHTAAIGNGPVNALDRALRKALVRFYPALREVSLTNYKVRIVDAQSATAAKVRVIIESRDRASHWTTVGVSENIIEASWLALVDSIEYKLLRDGHVRGAAEAAGGDGACS